jgi:signal transduction histidine kinase/CheY-like chemotaxis protein/HPt (histidine-containing phosphotransfer) domain-containing protein
MGSIFEKSKTLSSIYAQIMIVIVAFAIMGVSSFLFASSIERRHLIKDAKNALAFAEAEIIANLLEPETFLNSYSETVRSLIIKGESMEMISAFITDITNYMLKDDERMMGFIGIYGFINGKYISGRNWELPEGYVAQDRPWYQAAVDAGGKVAISDPYIDAVLQSSVLTFSRYLMDNEGNPLGVICLDMALDRIFKYAIDINLTDGSYGMLLNSKLDIIAHHEPYILGEPLGTIDSGLSELADELWQGLNVYERKVKNYMHETVIVFFVKIKFGWRLGIIIPLGEYYINVRQMAAFLFVLGCLLAAVLCIMLYQIAQAKKKSDLRTQQKSNFLATMSHEIRTPLNAILGIAEIQMLNTSLPPAAGEAFVKINNSGNLLLNIINDILDLSKIEVGKLELTPVRYEVASLINDIVQLNHIRYESKPIEFILDIDENIPSTLVGDELRIKQILNNLLSNAFKYTESGHVTLSANAECVGRGGAVLVTLIFQISDTGQGMTSEQIKKLFDEYTRFNMEANRTTEGAGLGITITRNLVELMYGKIHVKSAVGEGTTVTVRLPQKTDGVGIRGIIGKEMAENLRQFKHGNVVQLKKSQVTHEHMPYGHVLIVDDVETNLYVAKGLMAPYGLKIDLATSGFEALDRIKEGNVYDIIFMDHMMPKMDGIETTKLIRERGYTRPIVALTANALAGQAEMFLKNGFDGFISKPIDMRQLNVSLNRLIRDKQPSEVVEAAHRERAEMDKKTETGHVQQQLDSQLAEIFAKDAEKAAAVIESLLQKNLHDDDDIHMYVINVHAMKSALANVGELALSATALKLEHAGRDKDLSLMRSETRAFLDELRKVIEKIRPKYEEDENIEDTEETLALLREKLAVIKDACEAFDKKTAKTALNELREKTWSRNVKELLNKISEYLLHSEFDNVAALAGEYIEKNN